MEKRPLQRQEKKLKRPRSLEKHQKRLSLLIQTQMTNPKQERQPKKAPKLPEYSDDKQGPAGNYQRCIVMYSTEDEQEPAMKKLQKI